MDLVSRVKASEARFSIASSQLLIEASFRENPPDNQSDVVGCWMRLGGGFVNISAPPPLEASMLEFAWPWFGWLVGLPLLAILAPPVQSEELALRCLDSGSSANERSTPLSTLYLVQTSARNTDLGVLVIAGMQPRWVDEPISLPSNGRDLLLAVDISGSMGTEDMRLGGNEVPRLDAVKTVVGDFVELRKGDRLGLILFGTQAYLQAPLTFDRSTVRALLTETPIGIAGGKTAIGDAIGLAVKRLLDRPAEHRVLILLTDGVNNVGEVSPLQAAKLAAKKASVFTPLALVQMRCRSRGYYLTER